jgi:asparagine synthase (glutamine-hydrolysing)
MLETLAHRGPDDSGMLREDGLALGHRRLSIIELSPLGRQPMWSADGACAIVFNGEIYNHRALRQELLGHGVPFRGGSDTEALVNAIALFGLEGALKRCIGMFALAVWRPRDETLTLCRDRLGVKPLYYSALADRALFASEVRGLVAHPSFKPRLDRESLSLYLQRGFFPGEATPYDGARKLPPGATLTFARSGPGPVRRYWRVEDIERGAFVGRLDEAQEELGPLLKDAFRLRLESDAPVGLFLSGGVDSSLVAAVLRREVGADIPHFTIGFKDPAFNEAEQAKQIAARLGVRSELRYLSPDAAVREIENLCEVFDEPFGDASAIPTLLLCRFAREEVKVALSADGGDELFCGYTGYSRYPALYRRLRPIPHALRFLLAALLRAAPLDALFSTRLFRGLIDSRKLPSAQFRKLLDLMTSKTPREAIRLYQRKGFSEAASRALLGLAARPAQTEDRIPSEEMLQSMLRQDVLEWLPDDILTKVDRTSMHVSLECREPLLDHRIVEFASSLPMDFLLQGGEQKRILRRALRRYLDADLVDRPKRGFEIPLHDWLRGPWRSFARERLSRQEVERAGILDPALVSRELDAFMTRPGQDPMRVWLPLTVQMWAARWGRGMACA